MTNLMPSHIQNCKAREPRTCRYHADAYLAEDYRHAANHALKNNNWDDFQTYTTKAAEHQQRWEATVASGTLDKVKTPKETDYGTKKLDRISVNITKEQWQQIQDLAAKRDITIEHQPIHDNGDGTIRIPNFLATGNHNDIMRLDAEIGKASHDTYTETFQKTFDTPKTPFIGRGGPGKGGRDFETIDMTRDTPTEHVGTIPTFEEFKTMFGFGKKKQ